MLSACVCVVCPGFKHVQNGNGCGGQRHQGYLAQSDPFRNSPATIEFISIFRPSGKMRWKIHNELNLHQSRQSMCSKLRLPIAATFLQHLCLRVDRLALYICTQYVHTARTVCNRATYIPCWPLWVRVIHLHLTLTLFLERSAHSLKFALGYISRSRCRRCPRRRRRPRCGAHSGMHKLNYYATHYVCT